MKKYAMFFIILLMPLLLSGMSRRPSLEYVYTKGFQDGIESVAHQASDFRNRLRSGLEVQLFWYSIVIVGLTLWGAELAEWVRKKARDVFSLTMKMQVGFAVAIYGLVVLCILGWCDDITDNAQGAVMPVWIILCSTLIPFIRYIHHLVRGNTDGLKENMTKVKQLVVMCLVILILYQALSDGGFMGVRVGG